jgi:hypothetical protein
VCIRCWCQPVVPQVQECVKANLCYGDTTLTFCYVYTNEDSQKSRSNYCGSVTCNCPCIRGEKIQKRVYISSGKFPTFILKVPTFVWLSDTHFNQKLEIFPTKMQKIPKLNLLSTYRFAVADACCMNSLSQYCP